MVPSSCYSGVVQFMPILCSLVRGELYLIAIKTASQQHAGTDSSVEAAIKNDSSILQTFAVSGPIYRNRTVAIELNFTVHLASPTAVSFSMSTGDWILKQGWILNKATNQRWLFECPVHDGTNNCRVRATNTVELLLNEQPLSSNNSTANVAFNKPVTTSSIYDSNRPPSLCTDGVRKSHELGCFTESKVENWICVDLGTTFTIAVIMVTKRQRVGSVTTDVPDISIGVSDDHVAQDGVLVMSRVRVCKTFYSTTYSNTGTTHIAPCDPTETGRFVIVQVRSSIENTLGLTEVEAYIDYDMSPPSVSSIAIDSDLPWNLTVDKTLESCLQIPPELPYAMARHLFLVKYEIPWLVHTDYTVRVILTHQPPLNKTELETHWTVGMKAPNTPGSPGHVYKQCFVSEVIPYIATFQCACPEDSEDHCSHVYIRTQSGVELCEVRLR